jgi:hypothetical protein
VEVLGRKGVEVKKKGESSPTLPPIRLNAAEESDTRPGAEQQTDPAGLTPPEAPQSHLALYVALGTTIVALLLGLAYLFLR